MPILNNTFKVCIEDIGEVGVFSVSGLEVELIYTTIQCSFCSKIASIQTTDIISSNLTLVRAIDDSKVFFDWMESDIICPIPKTVTITLCKSQNLIVAQYKVYNAVVKKYKGPCLNALCEDIATESLEIKYSNLRRTI